MRARLPDRTRRLALVLLVPLLAACAASGPGRIAAIPADIPRFSSPNQPLGTTRSNLAIARDFIDLTFRLESGEQLPVLLKYEAPVRVALNSDSIATYRPELDALMRRLRAEARIDIAQTANRDEAQLFIEAIPRRSIQRVFPGAACFIIPGVRSWEEFRRPGRATNLRWSRQQALTVTTIFIPSDSTPQDTRDCLHEEIAQALGPANDLFRLPETVFNDDNFHSILTPFDMLILRVLYSDALTAGMNRDEVAARLPRLLRIANPRGAGAQNGASAPETRAYKRAIETALNRGNSRARRSAAARNAIELAGAMTPTDHRLGLAILTLGRIEARQNPERAVDLFETAQAQFDRQFGPRNIRSAHVAIHLSLMALRAGDYDRAIEIARFNQPVARRAENAVVLSGLYAVEAEALRAKGANGPARSARLESLAWARYAFGDSDGTIAKAQADIAAFNPNR